MNNSQLAILAAIYFTFLLSYLGLSVPAPFFPKEAHLKGVSATVSGWIFGVFALTQFLVSPFYGRVLAVSGCRTLCMLGLLLSGICTASFGMLHYVESPVVFVVLCFLVRIFLAMASTLLSNTGLVMLVQYFPDNIDTLFGIGEIFTGLGLMVGPALGGLLYSIGGYTVPFVVIGAISVASLPFFYCAIPAECNSAKQPNECLASRFVLHPRSLVNSLVIALTACVWSMLDPTLEPHLRQHGVGTSVVAAEFLVLAVSYAATSPLWGRLANRLCDKNTLIISGFILTAAGLLCLGPSPLLRLSSNYEYTWYTMLSLCVIGIASSMSLIPTYSIYIDILSTIDCKDSNSTYGMVSGLFVSMYALGSFIGPIVGGNLLDLIGFEWLVTWVAVSCMLACFPVSLSMLAGNRTETSVELYRHSSVSDEENGDT